MGGLVCIGIIIIQINIRERFLFILTYSWIRDLLKYFIHKKSSFQLRDKKINWRKWIIVLKEHKDNSLIINIKTGANGIFRKERIQASK